MNLLFVDDDPNLLSIFRKWTSIKGYNAKFAHDGSEVLELIQKETFDIIIMDIDMPILDGITTAEKLHKLAPNSKILILTGLHPKYYQNLPKNIIEILLKPISLSELSSKLSSLQKTQWL